MKLPSNWKMQLLLAAAIAFFTPIEQVDAFSNTQTTAALHRLLKNDGSSRIANRMDTVLLFQNRDPNSSCELEQRETPMKESDIIKMLRANPHQCSEPIEKASDVLHLISQSIPYNDSTAQSLSPEEVVNIATPNIAAAALRRLVSPPFIPLTFSTTKQFSQYLYKNQWSNPKLEINETEQQLYRQIVHLLVEKLRLVIDEQSQALMESTSKNDDQVSAPPTTLLSKKETWHHPPKKNATNLNWYALADLLPSLSVIYNVPQSNSYRNGYLQALMHSKDEQSIIAIATTLFHDTIKYLAWDSKVTSSFIRCVGSRRLIRDLIHPLVIGHTQQHRLDEEETRWDEDNVDEEDAYYDNLHHLMVVASEYLATPASLAKITANEISIVLWSLTQIYPTTQSLARLQAYRPFIKVCMKRLRKRAVFSPARGREIALAIRSIERLLNLIDGEDYANENSLEPFQDILSLPLQLPGEESIIEDYNMPTVKVNTDSTSSLFSTQPNGLAVVDDLTSEATIMFHTLTNELTFQPDRNRQMKLRSLSLQQAADILHTAVALEISREDMQSIVVEVLRYMTSDPLVLDQSKNCRDISRILLSLQRLRVGSGMYNIDLEKSCVEKLGRRFLEIVDRQSNGRSRSKCDPKTLTTIVRSGVMMFPGSDVTKPILDAASKLIRDDTIPVEVSDENDMIFVDYGISIPFLEQCNDYELSWCLWAYAVSRKFDKQVFLSLTDQILEVIEDSFTASSASRVMWSTSVLLSTDEAGDQHDGRHIDLFHQLSPILLSSHMSPTDLSCAMYAIAKTNYVFDRGVFDFLAEELTSDDTLERANTRLISQAVWACGKMAEFEDPIMSSSPEIREVPPEDESPNEPPYLNSVYKMLTYLINNQESMTSKHVAETCWAAFGRLSISDEYYLEEMSAIVSRVAHHCNSREIANIAWGFSKVDYTENAKLIRNLVSLIRSSDLSNECTSQEAANCIYALGRLGIRDRELFSALSSIIKNQIQDANSQTIANSLWAHDIVGLPAPPELLSAWARDTLGMDTIKKYS